MTVHYTVSETRHTKGVEYPDLDSARAAVRKLWADGNDMAMLHVTDDTQKRITKAQRQEYLYGRKKDKR